MKPHRRAALSRIGALEAASSVLALCGLFLALHACTVPDPFAPEYLDRERNWIGALGFDVRETQEASGWTFGYSGEVEDDYPYMALEDLGESVGSAAPEGLSPEAPVYRLSIANLMPDPGMEAEPLGGYSARWQMEIGFGAAPSAAAVEVSSIHGRSMSFDRDENTSQLVRLVLAPNLLNAAGPVSGSIYQINFLCRTPDSTLFYSLEGDDDKSFAVASNQVNDVRIPSQGYIDPGAVDYSLYFGPYAAQQAVLDDFRVVRRGIDLALVLKLRLSDAAPAFISGRYAFSVWVRNDPAASYLLGSGTVLPPYQARALSLSIRAVGSSEGGTRVVAISGADGWADWTRITAEIPEGEVLSIDQNAESPVLALRISPTDLSSATGLDAASILIAQPEFHFYLKNE